MNEEKYIALFDSGIGGLSVLAEARKLLPEENFIYFADVANAPYGEKTREEVETLLKKSVQALLAYPLKALVVACNTATSAGIAKLRQEMTIPVLGMEPALKPAVETTSGQIVVLATTLTLKEEKFRRLLETAAQSREVVPLPCPGLVELIEKGPENEEISRYLQKALQPYQDTMKAVVLGCTHYTFLKPVLNRLYPQAVLFDGGAGVSLHLQKVLQENALVGGKGRLLWLSSLKDKRAQQEYTDKCEDFYDYYRRFL